MQTLMARSESTHVIISEKSRGIYRCRRYEYETIASKRVLERRNATKTAEKWEDRLIRW